MYPSLCDSFIRERKKKKSIILAYVAKGIQSGASGMPFIVSFPQWDSQNLTERNRLFFFFKRQRSAHWVQKLYMEPLKHMSQDSTQNAQEAKLYIHALKDTTSSNSNAAAKQSSIQERWVKNTDHEAKIIQRPPEPTRKVLWVKSAQPQIRWKHQCENEQMTLVQN